MLNERQHLAAYEIHTVEAMTTSSRCCIHIGLPKTGTTTLQRNVFELHPGLQYFGQTNAFSNDRAQLLLRSILDDRDRSNLLPEARAASQELRAQTKPLVVSDEALTMGSFMARAQTWDVPQDHGTIAERTRDLFDDADVFIVLRQQVDWLRSWHQQGLKSRRYVEPSFDDWFEGSFVARAERLLALLDYENLCDEYAAQFGADRVHVWLYEDYRDRFPDLAAEMATIGGFDAHQARSLAAAPAQNVSDQGYRGIPRPLWKLLRSAPITRIANVAPPMARRRMRSLLSTDLDFGEGPSARVSHEIMQGFTSSNRRLFEKLGLATAGTAPYL